MTMTVHNYRPRQFHRTSNGENPSRGYRDMGSASLAAARPAARPPARPPGPWRQYPSSPEGWGVKRQWLTNTRLLSHSSLNQCRVILFTRSAKVHICGGLVGPDATTLTRQHVDNHESTIRALCINSKKQLGKFSIFLCFLTHWGLEWHHMAT